MLCTIIALFIDNPMFNVKYLAMHKVQMHAGAVSKLVYGSFIESSLFGILLPRPLSNDP